MTNKELVLNQIDKEIAHEIDILNLPISNVEEAANYTRLVINPSIALLELCKQYMHNHYDLIKPLESALSTDNEDELLNNIHYFISDIADDIVDSLDDTFFDECNLNINFRNIINFNIKDYM